MLFLPKEIVQLILGHVEYADLASLALTCKSLLSDVTLELQSDHKLLEECSRLVPWLSASNRPKFGLWRDILAETHSAQRHVHSPLPGNTYSSSLASTGRFQAPKRRPKFHQNSGFPGHRLLPHRKPQHLHELGVLLDGPRLVIHSSTNWGRCSLDTRTMSHHQLPKTSRLDWGYPVFAHVDNMYRYSSSAGHWHFRYEEEELEDVHCICKEDTLFAALRGARTNSLYLVRARTASSDNATVVRMDPFFFDDDPESLNILRVQLQEAQGAVFATVSYGMGLSKLLYVDWAQRRAHKLFDIAAEDLNSPLLVRGPYLYLASGGKLFKLFCDFSGHVDTEDHVTTHVVSVLDLDCDATRYRSSLDLDTLFGRYAVFWNYGGFSALLDLDSQVMTKIQNDAETVSMVSVCGLSSSGAVHIGRFTCDFLRPLVEQV